MEATRITDRHLLSDQKYKLEQVSFERTNHRGEKVKQKREVYYRPSSTSVLLYNESKKTILLTRQFRLPVYLSGYEGSLTEACAGLIDEGELPEQTIIREVEEETGYRISEIEQIFEAYLSPASLTERMYFFTGKYSADMKITSGGGLKEEGEDIQLLELSFEDAKQQLYSGSIQDAKTIILLQHALLKGIIQP